MADVIDSTLADAVLRPRRPRLVEAFVVATNTPAATVAHLFATASRFYLTHRGPVWQGVSLEAGSRQTELDWTALLTAA